MEGVTIALARISGRLIAVLAAMCTTVTIAGCGLLVSANQGCLIFANDVPCSVDSNCLEGDVCREGFCAMGPLMPDAGVPANSDMDAGPRPCNDFCGPGSFCQDNECVLVSEDAGPDAGFDAGTDAGPSLDAGEDAGPEYCADGEEPPLWYEDKDVDGYGDANSEGIPSCVPVFGHVANALDCDDDDATVYDGAPEIVADGIDQDCDDADACYEDADGDGQGSEIVIADTNLDCDDGSAPTSGVDTDCDDGDENISLGAPDPWYDGIDQDCLRNDDYDRDGDGFVPTIYQGLPTAAVPGTGTLPGGDCDDEKPEVNPDGKEIVFGGPQYCFRETDAGVVDDGDDNDCDGLVDFDDWDCQDDDADGIPNGVDAMRVLDTRDNFADGGPDGITETVCALTHLILPSEGRSPSLYRQGTPQGIWGAYVELRETQLVETRAVPAAPEYEEWCVTHVGEIASNTTYRPVSQYAEEFVDGGPVPADPQDCDTWIRGSFAEFCSFYDDALCDTFSSNDGCQFVGYVVGISWDPATGVSPK